jgi:hypothetical protein
VTSQSMLRTSRSACCVAAMNLPSCRVLRCADIARQALPCHSDTTSQTGFFKTYCGAPDFPSYVYTTVRLDDAAVRVKMRARGFSQRVFRRRCEFPWHDGLGAGVGRHRRAPAASGMGVGVIDLHIRRMRQRSVEQFIRDVLPEVYLKHGEK